MSIAQELIWAISNAQRQLDEQIMRLHSYVAELDRLTSNIHHALDGTQLDYPQKMMQQIAITKQEVEKSMNSLRVAKDKILQIRI